MSNLCDIVGNANFLNGENYYLVNDRFDNSNSAIYINDGYLQLSNDSYFGNAFTVIVWIKFKSYKDYARIFDFGNGPDTENIALTMYQKNLYADFFDQTNEYTHVQLNIWYHIAYVKQNKPSCFIYVNGNQIEQGNFSILNRSSSLSRSNNLNFIGKSNFDGDPKIDAVYDDLKIFSKALTSDDIISDYMYSCCSGGKII